jgi:hypothetical protein
MKSKKHTFEDFKISYLNKQDAEIKAKENNLNFNGEETCLFHDGFWGFEPLFCLKGNHFESLMEIKRKTKTLPFCDISEVRMEMFIDYFENHKNLEI